MKKIVDGIDFFFNKLLPKKLLVFVIATIIVLKGINAPSEYWYVLMAYMGVNIAGKFAGVLGKKDEDK